MVFAIEEAKGTSLGNENGLDIQCEINEGYTFVDNGCREMAIQIYPGEPILREIIIQKIDNQPKKTVMKKNLPFAHHMPEVDMSLLGGLGANPLDAIINEYSALDRKLDYQIHIQSVI